MKGEKKDKKGKCRAWIILIIAVIAMVNELYSLSCLLLPRSKTRFPVTSPSANLVERDPGCLTAVLVLVDFQEVLEGEMAAQVMLLV